MMSDWIVELVGKMINKCLPRVVLLILMGYSSLLSATPYKRIVSLDICSDWMLTTYAQRAQVAALSPLLDNYQVDWVRGEWPTHDGSLEEILELEPDLVIAGEYNAVVLRGRLSELGINVKILPLPDSLNSLLDYMQQFLSLVGNTASEIPVLSDLPTPDSDAPRLLLLGANAIGTGTQTMEHEVLQQAGWRNYITRSGYGKLDLEQLIIDPPDAVLWSTPTSRALANMFIEHPALKKVMKHKVSQNLTFGVWQCAGPWTWQQIEKLTTLREQWQQK